MATTRCTWARVNVINPGSGAVRFIAAYGGAHQIEAWAAEQIYDVSSWPARPSVSAADGAVTIRLGLSVIRIKGAPSAEAVETQIVAPE